MRTSTRVTFLLVLIVVSTSSFSASMPVSSFILGRVPRGHGPSRSLSDTSSPSQFIHKSIYIRLITCVKPVAPPCVH